MATTEPENKSVADSYQCGGDHYRKLAGDGEQHWTRIWRLHGRGYFIGCITKYVERYFLKNGVQDLEKARHYIDKLIELETEAASKGTAPGDIKIVPGDKPPPGGYRTESTYHRMAIDEGLGHWKPSDPNANGLWDRVDGWLRVNPFSDELAGPAGNWVDGLRAYDRLYPLHGARTVPDVKITEQAPEPPCDHDYDVFSRTDRVAGVLGSVSVCVKCFHPKPKETA